MEPNVPANGWGFERRGILDTLVVTELEDAHPYLRAWDRLAIASSNPFCSPAWMTAWWRHAAPRGSSLRLVLALEEDVVIGVAPFFLDTWARLLTRYRVLGAGCSSRLDLLARPGSEPDVAAAIASAVITTERAPDVVMFEGIASGSPWPELLADAWTRRSASVVDRFQQAAPYVDMQGRTYEEWFSAKGRHFRHHMRGSLRQVEREGGSFHLIDAHPELEQGLRSFFDLHHRRWRPRGGSGVLNAGVERMLVEMSRLPGDQPLSIWTMDVDGQPVGAHVYVSTGYEIACWLGGFDETWGRLQPALLTMLTGIEHAFSLGCRRMDLGPGTQEYKLRLGDGTEDLRWVLVVPSGPLAPLARTQLLRQRVRLAIAGRLSPHMKRAIRRVRARIPGRRGRSGSPSS